ncbi:uncharacterized protein Tco025E_04836 [Trypanosoma conorhini]|uniref:Uncharacterized protein n=1 Tax=Trypanosoma conorhini TaxID=83891 RepID=A0A422PIA0_9TRYP|nr:uncharacterized protein Tco025E_04836 [Trypanosoma conorhini]RNF17444.1 hypothetical protein Tco025E_04836 [Trypanosoma conorhini]
MSPPHCPTPNSMSGRAPLLPPAPRRSGGARCQRSLLNPMCAAFSRKHWRQTLSSYLRMSAFWLEQITQWRAPLPMPIFWRERHCSRWPIAAGCAFWWSVRECGSSPASLSREASHDPA